MKRLLSETIRAIRSRAFGRILIYYGIIFILLVLVCASSFLYARDISLANIRERNRLILDNAGMQIANALQLVETFNNSLYTNTRLQAFMRTQKDSTLLYSAYMLLDELPKLYDSSGLLTGYFIHVPMNDYIVAPRQCFVDLNLYYQDHFALSSAQDAQAWRRQVLQGPANSFHAKYDESPHILYATRLASRFRGVQPGCVVYRLSGAQLLDLITRSFSGSAQLAYITDMQGHILCASDGYVPDFDGNGYTRISSDIAFNRLQANILVSNSAISLQAAQTVSPILSLLAWMLGIGLVLIILTTAANLKPLLTLAVRSETLGGNARGMWRINETFAHVDRRAFELQQALSAQKAYLKTACVHRMIHGHGADAYPLEEMMASAGMALPGTRFYACVIVLNVDSCTSELQMAQLDALRAFANRLMVLALEGPAVTLAVYSEADEELDGRKAFFTTVFHALKNGIHSEVSFYIGSRCESLDKLPESFATARWLRNASTADTWLNLSDSIPEDADLGGVLTEAEQSRLQGMVLAGTPQPLLQSIDALRQEYFLKSNAHGFRRQYIYCRLVEVLVTCGSVLDISEDLPPNLLLMSTKEFFDWITGRLLMQCREAECRLQSKTRQLGEEVFRYIEEHYADYALTLSSVSAHLNVTGPYLSGLFKKQIGMNFSVHLERVRIRHAEDFLRRDTLNMDELAQKVGYGNADSFRRAFKRVTGVTPTKYRESVLAQR